MKKENELTTAAKLIAESVSTFASCMGMYTANSKRRVNRIDDEYSEFDFAVERVKLLSKIAELEKAIINTDEEKFEKPLKFNKRICVTVSNEKQISALLDFLSDVGYTLCDIPYDILTTDIFKTFTHFYFYSYGDNNEKVSFSFGLLPYEIENNDLYFTNDILSTFTKESFLDRYLVKY